MKNFYAPIGIRTHDPQFALGDLGRVKRIWYLSPMRGAKVQVSLRIRAVSPEPPQLAHTSSESRGTFRQKARSLAPLNGWACAVKICHDGMLEDTNSLGGAHLMLRRTALIRSCLRRTYAVATLHVRMKRRANEQLRHSNALYATHTPGIHLSAP